jgi:uncharacterized protein with NRDE domain
MCLAVFAYRTDPDYPLVLATNRDEFYDREAEPAHYWDEHPNLLAGKDTKAGGTWLGITKNNRFAAITNYRDIGNIKQDAPSRGSLVKNFLTSGLSAPDYYETVLPDLQKYNGFNLLLGTTDNLYYFNNQKPGLIRLQPGFHSLSNAFLNTSWPKTDRAVSDLKSAYQSGTPDKEQLLELLQNRERYPDPQLPDTGLSREMERVVSSIFITSDNYGTRCSTVIYSARSGDTEFTEITYEPGTTTPVHNATFQF